MRTLGVDPGIIALGYGIIDGYEQMRMVDYGVLKLSSRTPIEDRLQSFYTGLSKIIDKHCPDEVAVEEPFMGQNVKSAFAIGRAQAIVILAATNKELPVYRYSPAQVKQQITSYGGSDKEQVQEMVKILLGLSQPPQPSDAADALAVAICHIQQVRFNAWLTQRT